ncbi:general odorant-binding protein 56a-like [Anopheles marshallii]|uniref:general odorant-binding protein 56a-like n=1 Tax=Anopheles marshallii TaxID=1521116 RepID=UPI00237C47B4|nr:general odorant-binding protein 56a-like [Anopheles marshallii]
MQNLQIVFLVLLGAVTTLAFFTEEQHEIAKSLADACHAELGGELPEDFATKMRLGDPTLDSETSKCTIQCIFAKVGFTDENGVANRGLLIAKLSKGNPVEKATTFADVCEKNDGDSKCDKAFSLYQCYNRNKSIFA